MAGFEDSLAEYEGESGYLRFQVDGLTNGEEYTLTLHGDGDDAGTPIEGTPSDAITVRRT